MSDSDLDLEYVDDDDADFDLPGDEEDVEEIQPAFERLSDWVEVYLAPITQVNRAVVAGQPNAWDPRWWRHTAVVVRLEALWRAWEGARVSQDPQAMSSWFIHHYDPTMRALMAADGPMGLSGADGGGVRDALPTAPAPDGQF